MKTYQHTQSAKAILTVLCIAFCFFAVGAINFHPLVVPMIVLWLSAWIFRSMTIEISETDLTWYFGPGFPRKSVRLSEIASVKAIRTSFWNGWGIHYTPRGWLYNVSGHGAVAITLRNGKRFCLG